jgi:hypothetical protein
MKSGVVAVLVIGEAVAESATREGSLSGRSERSSELAQEMAGPKAA